MRLLMITMITILILLSCSIVDPVQPVQFELRKGSYGFGDEKIGDCIILTSKDFWVDRAEISDILWHNGVSFIGINPCQASFIQPDSMDADAFIEYITPVIADIGGKIKRGWNSRKLYSYMTEKYGYVDWR